MDELVRRLRTWASDLTREAACGGVWQESIDANHARSETLRQAADAITTLTAALVEVTEVLELRCRQGETAADGGFDGGRITRSLNAARAALREVGR
jgi:hypothetical protein